MSGFELLARPLPRRAVLAASGTAVLAAAAACSSGGSPSGTTSTSSPASSPVPSPPGASSSASPPGAPSAAGSPTGTASSAAVTSAPPAETSAAEPVPAGPALASVADVQAAGALVVGDGADPHLLAYSGDAVVAHTAICTHQGCTVAASGMCPCHGSRYDVTTGAVLNGPALRPLAELPVTVSGGQVYAG